eukprot:Hpha_TRINITY_DN16101_c3_g4::TRINITY_DN16101_c3_g4_i1::g.8967::m.8967
MTIAVVGRDAESRLANKLTLHGAQLGQIGGDIDFVVVASDVPPAEAEALLELDVPIYKPFYVEFSASLGHEPEPDQRSSYLWRPAVQSKPTGRSGKKEKGAEKTTAKERKRGARTPAPVVEEEEPRKKRRRGTEKADREEKKEVKAKAGKKQKRRGSHESAASTVPVAAAAEAPPPEPAAPLSARAPTPEWEPDAPAPAAPPAAGGEAEGASVSEGVESEGDEESAVQAGDAMGEEAEPSEGERFAEACVRAATSPEGLARGQAEARVLLLSALQLTAGQGGEQAALSEARRVVAEVDWAAAGTHAREQLRGLTAEPVAATVRAADGQPPRQALLPLASAAGCPRPELLVPADAARPAPRAAAAAAARLWWLRGVATTADRLDAAAGTSAERLCSAGLSLHDPAPEALRLLRHTLTRPAAGPAGEGADPLWRPPRWACSVRAASTVRLEWKDEIFADAVRRAAEARGAPAEQVKALRAHLRDPGCGRSGEVCPGELSAAIRRQCRMMWVATRPGEAARFLLEASATGLCPAAPPLADKVRLWASAADAVDALLWEGAPASSIAAAVGGGHGVFG